MLRDDVPTVVASALASLMDYGSEARLLTSIDYGNASKNGTDLAGLLGVLLL